MPNKSEDKLKKEINKNINSKIELLQLKDNRNIKNEFLEKYAMCEFIAKHILNLNEMESINISNLKTTLKKNNCKIDSNTLDLIFNTKDKNRKKKSARNLRNGIAHVLNIPDIKEVIERKDVLFENMDNFIKYFI